MRLSSPRAQEVAAAAYYLPTYDLRQARLAVDALKEQMDAGRTALQPRKKFSFSRKAPAAGSKAPQAAAAGQEPAANGAAGGEGGATGGSSDEHSNMLQQLLGSSGIASTSGRCGAQRASCRCFACAAPPSCEAVWCGWLGVRFGGRSEPSFCLPAGPLQG